MHSSSRTGVITLVLLTTFLPFFCIACGDGDSELAASLAGIINGQVVEVDQAIEDLPNWVDAEEADVGAVFPVLKQVFPQGLPTEDILHEPAPIRPAGPPHLQGANLAISVLDGHGNEMRYPLDDEGRFSIPVHPEETYLIGIIDLDSDRYLGPLLFGEEENQTTLLSPTTPQVDLGQIRWKDQAFIPERDPLLWEEGR